MAGNTMPAKAHTKADWDEHADEIRELLKEKTFSEVAAYMEAEHNFSATERQYKYRFGKAKNLTEQDWKWIQLEMQSRAAAGKQSRVYFNGTLQTDDRVNRAMARYGKRAHSEIDSNGENPYTTIFAWPTYPSKECQIHPQKGCLSGTPPALTPEPNLDQNDIPMGNEVDIWALETSVLYSTIEQTSEVSVIADPESGLEVGRLFSFESSARKSTSPGFQPLSPGYFDYEAFFASPRNDNNELVMMPITSPREWGQGEICSRANLTADLTLVQDFLEQRAHMSQQAYSMREYSQSSRTSIFDGLSTEAGRQALKNLLGPGTEYQLQENFPQIVSKLENIVPEREPNALSKQLSSLMDSRSISSSGVWFLFGLAAYFSSNNILEDFRTDTFLRWVIDQHFTEQLEKCLDIKAPTIQAFSINILKSAIRIKSAKLVTGLLKRGIMLDRPMNEVDWIDNMELAKLVLDRFDPKFFSGRTGPKLLRHFLRNNYLDLVQRLIDNGVSVDTKLDERTQLYVAVDNGEVRNVRFLLECGADVNSTSRTYGFRPTPQTALAAAVVKKQSEIVVMLLEHHANTSCKLGNMELLEWTSLKDRNMYNLLKKRVGNVGFNLGDLVFAASEGSHQLKAYKGRHHGATTTHQLERALHESIQLEQSAAIVALLQSGVSPDGDTLHERPLETAVGVTKSFQICQILINFGATVDIPGVLKEVVASRDSRKLLPLFMESKVNFDYQSVGALVEAAAQGDIISAIYLLERGVDVNTPDLNLTPLQAAASSGELKMVELLLSYNANIDAPAYPNGGRTALQASLSTLEWNYEVTGLLLERGANVSAPPAAVEGLTALEAICIWWDGEEEERRTMCHRLLDAGAPVNRPEGEASWLLHRIIQNVDDEDDILVRFLEPHRKIILEYMWAEPETEDHDEEPQRMTPIQLAAEYGHIEQVRLLFHHGANINADPAPRFGRTALQAAASIGNKELVEFLLANGAEVNAKPAVYGRITALQGAAISGNVMLVALLLEKGARVNAEPSVLEGRYAIEGAAEHGRLDTVQLLLNAGATGNVREKKGYDVAIELAKGEGYSEVVALLEEAEQRRLHNSISEE